MEKRVLIYYPPNKRAIALNAVVDLLVENCVDLYVLTQEPPGQLHIDLEGKFGHKKRVFSANESNEKFSYYKNIRSLISFCKVHKIEIIFSHLQPGNLVALVAAKFLPGVKVFPFRHHFQYFKKFSVNYLKSNRNELIGEKIVNILSDKIVVPSSTVRNGMIEYENVAPDKIKILPYIYNFNEYPEINFHNVQKIRSANNCYLLLLMSSRFIEAKRHGLVLNVIAKLVHEKKMDLKLLLLDDGPLKSEIKKKVEELKLSEKVVFVGYTDRIMDYMAASDLLVHPSLSEASNSSVKEMGLAGRTAIVCKGVGDFDDYIEHKRTGFLIDPMNSEKELLEVLEYAYENKASLLKIGDNLKNEVLAKFSPGSHVYNLYQSLIYD